MAPLSTILVEFPDNDHDEVVAKGNLVLDTEQFSVGLLRYWAEHDRVVRQVYNSLCDLDEALWSCTLDMYDEMRLIREFRQMLIDESQGYFDATGQFDPAGGHGIESQLITVDEPVFSVHGRHRATPSLRLLRCSRCGEAARELLIRYL
eukprot:SAG31_NODE_8636_length_1416_cov_5.760061_3_plen_149_part_00